MKERSLTTGISIEMNLLKEIDQRRREIGLKTGTDLPRSTYICQLVRKALDEDQKRGVQ